MELVSSAENSSLDGKAQSASIEDIHDGRGYTAGIAAWKRAAEDPVFQQAQDAERDDVSFNPAVGQAKKDGLGALGQFTCYDAMVMHGPGTDRDSFGGIRAAAMRVAKSPAQGGNETTWPNAPLVWHTYGDRYEIATAPVVG
ncbi:MAG TPA: chitosanase [Galbitalea sp.]